MSVTREFMVQPGLHTITASAEGYYTQQRTVDVQQDMTVQMTLQPISSGGPGQGSLSPTMLIAGAGIIVAVLMIVILANSGDKREESYV